MEAQTSPSEDLMVDPAFNHELRSDDRILVLEPGGPLATADFTALASHVDSYLEQHGTPRGILIHARTCPGWNDLDALLAQLKFIEQHHRKIKKVALFGEGGIAAVMPFIASRFVHMQVKHFDHAHHENAAWDWLMDSDRTQMRTAA